MTRMIASRKVRDAGRRDEAKALLQVLWEEVKADKDEYLMIAIAHDYGHVETEPELQLPWHLEALRLIEAHHDQHRVRLFPPSAHLNVGLTYLRLGERDLAKAHLESAQQAAPILDDNDYGQHIRKSIADGLAQLER